MSIPFRPTSRSRGFALMLVLIVMLTSSVLMIGMYQSLHLQTSESIARQQIAVNRSLADAAYERAAAMLLQDPGYEGDEKFETPPGSGQVSILSVHPSQADKELIEMTLTIRHGRTETSSTRTLSLSDIEARRQQLGLK